MSHVTSASRYFVSVFFLSTLLLAAFGLRFWHIESIPGGLYPDEATNATDALRANETGDYRLFYENNYGREGLFINLQALSIKIFGPHVWALKLWSAVFGTLAVLGVYLLALELWRKRWVALSAAFMMACSYWAINFSRIGFRAVMMPFLLSFIFYFFFRGLRTKSLVSFLLSGFLLGLGLHTYIAFRITPLIFIILFVGLIPSYKGFLRIYRRHALVFCVGAFLSAAPMFYDFFKHSDHFISRSSAISVFEPTINHGNLPGTLAKTIALSLIKYNFWGDQNWRHNYPPYPILDPITGVLFLAGVLFLVPRTIHLARRRFRDHDRNREFAICLFLLGWFFTMLLPEFLTNEGLPHSLRSIGTQPVVFLIAALPLLWIGERFARSGHGTRLVFLSIFAASLMTIALWNSIKYFVLFANNPIQHAAFNHDITNMAAYLRSLPPELHKYVYANAGGTTIDNGLPVTAQPIVFLTYGQIDNLTYILPDKEFALDIPSVLILMNYNESFIQHIRAEYPSATVEKIDLTPGTHSDFTIIKIN